MSVAAMASPPSRQRLDHALVAAGLCPTRARARDAILRGHVTVGGIAAERPAAKVGPDDALALNDPARGYVARSALKLIAALDAFSIDVRGRVALDLGASTGGFAQVLLERGATHVTAIDVGHGQMDAAIARDPRVEAIEGLNARDLTHEHLPNGAPAIVTADLSFISLTLALPPALALGAPGAVGVFLIKPQFEAGRAAIGRGGLLDDPQEAPRIAQRLSDWLARQTDWYVRGLVDSPIRGGDGNREFLLVADKLTKDAV